MAHHLFNMNQQKLLIVLFLHQRQQGLAKANGEAPEAESEWRDIHAPRPALIQQFNNSNSTAMPGLFPCICVIRVLLVNDLVFASTMTTRGLQRRQRRLAPGSIRSIQLLPNNPTREHTSDYFVANLTGIMRDQCDCG